MGKITEQEISESIKNDIENTTHNILLLNLFKAYERFNSKELEKDSLIKISTAYKTIKDKITFNFETNKLNLTGEMLTCIKNNFVPLTNCMNNFRIDDTKKITQIKDYITILEGYLNLSITFPERLETCLNKELTKKKENKRMRYDGRKR